ncbi:deacetylvindoline O-acetyltransferase-like [Prunus yedoensis var. nudiflora]|uniref:Deacetylvindoline O-acetyltransferase-like n=1 Tax=Prunus yedoensis var. nudiflora TaxID=2094558 RepID=A0A314XH51_PRUYE|nr:deacetylvindoline O-acetyltransferase-like [Prunus yedoensis var. nudiflora]
MEVEIISRETIKPFTSTSPHNRTYNLSFLEQVNPRTYVPVVYFYPKEASETPDFLAGVDKSNQLKKSLSETLAKYYPFAEARIKNIELSEILEHPKDEVLDLLFTDNLQWNEDSNINVLLAVQVSFLDCGGMAVGICMSHKIADTSTMINFINDWAAVARNNKKCDQYVPSPEFISATVFPRCDLPLSPEAMIEKSNCVTKRFVFDATKIAALKAIVAEKLQNPTRVEAVTAFIHSRAISALRSTSGSSQTQPLSSRR